MENLEDLKKYPLIRGNGVKTERFRKIDEMISLVLDLLLNSAETSEISSPIHDGQTATAIQPHPSSPPERLVRFRHKPRNRIG